jgi:hypothetical protein
LCGYEGKNKGGLKKEEFREDESEVARLNTFSNVAASKWARYYEPLFPWELSLRMEPAVFPRGGIRKWVSTSLFLRSDECFVAAVLKQRELKFPVASGVSS